MALKLATPRDRLDRLMDYARRARRYWWLVMAFVVIGGGLSVIFAITREPIYESHAVLFHQERIQSSLLSGRDGDSATRNIGDRYRELLLARTELAKIINDPELNPFADVVAKEGVEAAVEKLRTVVEFSTRGGSTYRITYKDPDPDRAKAVTERLAELLIARDSGLKTEAASMTMQFAEKQKESADADLRIKEHALAQFLAKHPEFAADTAQGAGEGAAIRAGQVVKKTPGPSSSNPRINALERQQQRIRARLAVPTGSSVQVPVRRPRTPEQIAAERAVDDAEREVNNAQRALDDAKGRVTDRHPDYRKASDALAAAQMRLRRAQAAVPPDVEEVIAPASATDRAELQKELQALENQIDRERTADRARASGEAPKPEPTPAVDPTARVVELETTWAKLKREVDEQRQVVSNTAASVFVAETEASAQLAEEGASLSYIDHAFKPMRPIGKGKTILVIVGLFLFGALGAALAVGLAIIDDRVYRRADLEQLELAPVLAIIPRADKREMKRGS